METREVQITIYYKRDASSTTMYVEQLSENKFRMSDNDIFNCRLTKGTEFITRVNDDGNHEIIKITKKSDFITRRFFLSPKYKTTDYGMLGEELTKRGGFWQVDFGGIVTVNIPKDFEFDVDQIMREWNLDLGEITDN